MRIRHCASGTAKQKPAAYRVDREQVARAFVNTHDKLEKNVSYFEYTTTVDITVTLIVLLNILNKPVRATWEKTPCLRCNGAGLGPAQRSQNMPPLGGGGGLGAGGWGAG